MTGIGRLRELAEKHRIIERYLTASTIDSIADQIEHELSEERDRCDSELCEAQMDKTRVMSVYLEMNRHVLGHEGAEDSPVARWARELRDALKSDTSDSADAQKPSCANPDGTADVTSEAAKVTSEDADAARWVREHGGLERVNFERDSLYGTLRETCWRLGVEYFGVLTTDAQHIWRKIGWYKDRLAASVPRVAYGKHIIKRQRQIDESHAALRRRNERIVELERELRDALGGEKHDPAEDVSMSAYDLLPQDERDAIAWVREHGGLEAVKERLDWVVGHCSTKQQLDFDFWLSGRVMYALGFDEDMADRDEVERRLTALPVRGMWSPGLLTHKRPKVDSWERLENDATMPPWDYCEGHGLFEADSAYKDLPTNERFARDLVRRAKALAGDA